jgi:hypothetical protein
VTYPRPHPAFFEHCTLKSVVALHVIRNTAANHGNVFMDCTFIGTAEPTTLARSPKNGNSTYPRRSSLWNCTLSGILLKDGCRGWRQGAVLGMSSSNTNGSPVDVAQRRRRLAGSMRRRMPADRGSQ